MSLTLLPDSIHLWFAFPDEITDQALLESYVNLLTEEEKTRWQRFYFARHRHQFLITRALIRSTLSNYIDIAPQDWRFSTNQYGKPEINRDFLLTPLRFNLSHTDGLVMCGITLNNDLGVDVENLERTNATLNIAGHFFSEQEVQDLNNVPESQQKQRFFEYWTLKEAYIKARGMGLSLPLDQFGFSIHDGFPLAITFDSRMEDNPKHWRFWRLRPSERHLAAVALKSETHSEFQLLIKKAVPLQSAAAWDLAYL